MTIHVAAHLQLCIRNGITGWRGATASRHTDTRPRPTQVISRRESIKRAGSVNGRSARRTFLCCATYTQLTPVMHHKYNEKSAQSYRHEDPCLSSILTLINSFTFWTEYQCMPIACQMDYISADFSVDSSSHFPFRIWKQAHTQHTHQRKFLAWIWRQRIP